MPTPTPEELLEERLAELKEQNEDLRQQERAKVLELRRLGRVITAHRQKIKSKQLHIEEHEAIQNNHNQSIDKLNDEIAIKQDILDKLREE